MKFKLAVVLIPPPQFGNSRIRWQEQPMEKGVFPNGPLPPQRIWPYKAKECCAVRVAAAQLWDSASGAGGRRGDAALYRCKSQEDSREGWGRSQHQWLR